MMTFWNVRIGFVLNYSISQFNQESGNQPQIKNMIQKRKVLLFFFKYLNHLRHSLDDNLVLYLIYVRLHNVRIGFGPLYVGNTHHILRLLVAVSNISHVRNFSN